MKMFPRASAHAERLWTNPTTKSVEAQKRLVDHTHRLSQRGVGADAVQVSNLRSVRPKPVFGIGNRNQDRFDCNSARKLLT